jgi:hypothetical protein
LAHTSAFSEIMGQNKQMCLFIHPFAQSYERLPLKQAVKTLIDSSNSYKFPVMCSDSVVFYFVFHSIDIKYLKHAIHCNT